MQESGLAVHLPVHVCHDYTTQMYVHTAWAAFGPKKKKILFFTRAHEADYV